MSCFSDEILMRSFIWPYEIRLYKDADDVLYTVHVFDNKKNKALSALRCVFYKKKDAEAYYNRLKGDLKSCAK